MLDKSNGFSKNLIGWHVHLLVKPELWLEVLHINALASSLAAAPQQSLRRAAPLQVSLACLYHNCCNDCEEHGYPLHSMHSSIEMRET
jgi:hypothetical protein